VLLHNYRSTLKDLKLKNWPRTSSRFFGLMNFPKLLPTFLYFPNLFVLRNFLQTFCIQATVSGVVQYYTCKTVAIGRELLVFYGAEYFKEMGYDTTRDDDGNTTGKPLNY
jgi:hypothetical protein